MKVKELLTILETLDPESVVILFGDSQYEGSEELDLKHFHQQPPKKGYVNTDGKYVISKLGDIWL